MIEAHAFGCSYTAGQELCDEVIFPNYFKDIRRIQKKRRPHDQKDNANWWSTQCAEDWFAQHHEQDYVRGEDKLAREYARAWPAKLGYNLGIEVINHGQYGAGMDTILKEIIDLLDRNEINFDTPIIIGLPNAFRYINQRGFRTTTLMWGNKYGPTWADAAPCELTMDLLYWTGLSWIVSNFKRRFIVRCTDAFIGHNSVWQSRINSLGVSPVTSLIDFTHNACGPGMLEIDNLRVFFPGGHPREFIHQDWANLITPYAKKDLKL